MLFDPSGKVLLDLKAISGFWPFKDETPALPLRSTEGAPYGFLSLSELVTASGSIPHRREEIVQKKRRIKASRGGRWPDDTAAELLGPVSFSTGAGSFLLSRAEGGQREDGRAAASVLAQVRRCSS